ncbi:IclR family transcriptional regulator [Dethiosulfatarculus sandiegensis]|uniref:IclR family transcriptional regulator n=1 Tax=Dethiosulfatarculus sandiegensis TaxID=1429043 RepID=A0A0D2GH04_9BACT|nr:IclR family transcriptional regulator [Dethiosulfatarculus sandiegensis]KIX14212.1 IclR family transcriptional regulator [Dethiosulfatarculus sandiegensis]
MKVVESLKKGLSLLESFSVSHPRLKLQDLVHRTGLPKATAYRMLRTLMSLNYVRYDPVSTEYYLGPKVMSLGFAVMSSLDLREKALPYLEELSRKTDQNANLGILDGMEVVYIERVKKRRIVNIDLTIGSRLAAHSTSIGRAILAFLEPDELDLMIENLLLDPLAITQIGEDGAKLRQELELVRERGYAINDEELVQGLRAVGAPVFNAAGKVQAAINIAEFSRTCSRTDLLNKHVPMLLKTAETLSRASGHQG